MKLVEIEGGLKVSEGVLCYKDIPLIDCPECGERSIDYGDEICRWCKYKKEYPELFANRKAIERNR